MRRLTTLANIGLIALLIGLLSACSVDDDHSSNPPQNNDQIHTAVVATAPETAAPQLELIAGQTTKRQIPTFTPTPPPAGNALSGNALSDKALSDIASTDHNKRHRPQVAIIIDDIGYHLQHGVEAARLPGSLTLAVLPHSPNGVALAELGHEQGKEIILHNPMSTIAPRPLDPGGLTDTMDQQEFEAVLEGNLASIPHVSGLNNHMGSRLTQLEQPMQWLMHTLARENLFFIDSRTSAQSVALNVAHRVQIPSRKRDVFLDNDRNPEAIARQFEQLIHIALSQGSAIGIGHPYPETLAFLLQVMPQASELGIELVPVSRLLPTYTAHLDEPLKPVL